MALQGNHRKHVCRYCTCTITDSHKIVKLHLQCESFNQGPGTHMSWFFKNDGFKFIPMKNSDDTNLHLLLFRMGEGAWDLVMLSLPS